MSGISRHHIYEFGEFRLDAETPSLWRGDDLVQIFPKSLDILVLLVRRHGEVVTREELLEAVWPDTFVEESNITYTVSQLRKALGRDGNGSAIQTVPKRGYRFAADVREVVEEQTTQAESVPQFDHRVGDQPGILPKVAANGARVLPFSRRSNALPAEFILPDGSDLPESEVNEDRASSRSRYLRFFSVGIAAIAIAFIGFAGYQVLRQTKAISAVEGVNLKKLTFTGDITFPVIAPDGNSFAFVRGGAVFVQDLDSGDEIRLNVGREKVFGILQFSPDGKSLYFRDHIGFDLAGSVFQVSRFGGEPRLIAGDVWSGFGFSPDGRQMAFVRVDPGAAKAALIVKNTETGAERSLTELNLPSEFLLNGHPAWSSDGGKIAVVVFKKLQQAPESQLAVVDVRTGAVSEVNTPQIIQFEQAAWLRDSGDLLVSAREKGKFFQLWRLNLSGELQKITNDLSIYRGISLSADGTRLLARQFTLYSHLWVGESDDLSNLKQKTFGNLNRDGASGITWMPNREEIVHVARIMGDYDLWAYRPADDSRRQLTKNAGLLNQYPAASPDGRSIFFTSNRSGAIHIWRMDASGANQTQITFGEKQIDLHPQVSPDGTWLYFIQKGASASAVWRKSLVDERIEPLTEAGKLAPDSFLSISPDGKLLAFYNAVGKAAEEDKKQIYQIAIVPTDSPGEPKFVQIAASRLIVRWARDGMALDYIENDPAGARIWRKAIDSDKPPTLVVEMPKAFLHNFAWSPDGERLAMSLGQQSNDAILLTNFQP